VMPGGAWRFMTVAEVARAFMLAFGSPLWQALVESDALKPLQAVERMGRGIHVGVAQAIVAMLVAEGSLQPGATYASAYSGIDMFAAAVDAELEGEWRYSFASEPDVLSRRVLLQAWGQRGLRAERCYLDACSTEARQEASVDLWVSSPECTSHSPANRGDEGNVSAAQAASLAAIWQSLDYVRRARPRAVVLENVAQRSISGPLTGLLSRLGGYSVRTGVLDPQTAADAPIARERQFWVLTAVVAEQSG
jgi:hypothetical protein